MPKLPTKTTAKKPEASKPAATPKAAEEKQKKGVEQPLVVDPEATKQKIATDVVKDLIKRVDSLEKRVTVLEKSPAKNVKTGQETAMDTITIPGFELVASPTTEDPEGVDVFVDREKMTEWDVEQMLAVANALGLDLTDHRKEPREVRRRLFDFLRNEYKVVPIESSAKAATEAPEAQTPEVKSASDAGRKAAKMAEMPLDVPLGKDGLPKSSPVVGTHPGEDDGWPHIERDEWRTDKKFLRMHVIAEDFRRGLVAAKVWECPGFNCHDCLESEGNLVQAAKCHQYFSKEYPKQYKYQFPSGTSDYVPASQEAYVAKHELDE